MRHVFVSDKAKQELKFLKLKKREFHSFFPCDNGNCECQPMVREWKSKLANMTDSEKISAMAKQGYLTCPKDKTGLKQYKLRCNNCNAIVGYVWARDARLNDWCDFHYYSYHDDTEWIGAFGPHISPIDGKICIECTCGVDTRDFRMNKTLPASLAVIKESQNLVGRDFGNEDSKYSTEEIKNA